MSGIGPRPAVLLALAIGVGIIVAAVSRVPPEASGPPFPAIPAAACQGPGSAAKAGQAASFEWQPVVEVDRPGGSAIVLTAGDSTMICIASRSADGSLGAVVSGIGTYPPVGVSALTLDSGAAFTANGSDVVYGRVPAGTSRVLVKAGDQDGEAASVRNGHWLIWFTVPSTPLEIDAYNAAGHVLRRLADPNGLQFGG